jgi:hypothetical protein
MGKGLYDWMDRESEQNIANNGLGEQSSPDIAPVTENDAYVNAIRSNKQTAAAPQAPAGSGGLSSIAGMATAGGMATANPALAGAGLALQTMGKIQEQKAAQRNATYQAEVAKINARQDAINRMAQIGAGLKA